LYNIVKTGCKLAGGCKIISILKMYIGIIKILNFKKRIIKINFYIDIDVDIGMDICVEASVKRYDVAADGVAYISRRSRSSVLCTPRRQSGLLF
jgi:hypothetical protein